MMLTFCPCHFSVTIYVCLRKILANLFLLRGTNTELLKKNENYYKFHRRVITCKYALKFDITLKPWFSFLVHVSNEAYLAENLEKLGNNALNRDHEVDIGTFETFKSIGIH